MTAKKIIISSGSEVKKLVVKDEPIEIYFIDNAQKIEGVIDVQALKEGSNITFAPILKFKYDRNSSKEFVMKTYDECFLKYACIKDVKSNQMGICIAGSFEALINQFGKSFPAPEDIDYVEIMEKYGIHHCRKTHLDGIFYLQSNVNGDLNGFIDGNKIMINNMHIKSILNASHHNIRQRSLLRKLSLLPNHLKHKYPNSKSYLLTSGIDSFVLGLITKNILDVNVHASKLIHSLGHYQLNQVREFYKSEDCKYISNNVIGYNPKAINESFQSWANQCKYASYRQNPTYLKNFTWKLVTDLRCRDFIQTEFSSSMQRAKYKLIIRGNGTSQYQCFSGSLQRDNPPLLGHLRGSLRRIQYHPYLLTLLYILCLFRSNFSYQNALLKLIFIFSINSSRHQGKHERKSLSLSYLFRGNTLPEINESLIKEYKWLIQQLIYHTSKRSLLFNPLNISANLITLWKEFFVYQRQLSHVSEIYDVHTRYLTSPSIPILDGSGTTSSKE